MEQLLFDQLATPLMSDPSADAGSGTPNQTGFWEFNNKFPNELYTSSSLI